MTQTVKQIVTMSIKEQGKSSYVWFEVGFYKAKMDYSSDYSRN